MQGISRDAGFLGLLGFPTCVDPSGINHSLYKFDEIVAGRRWKLHVRETGMYSLKEFNSTGFNIPCTYLYFFKIYNSIGRNCDAIIDY